MRIAFVGDSFVNGYGDPEGRGWVGRVVAAELARGRDITAYNLGIRRDTSVDVAARWAEEVRRRLPDGVDGRIVFSFGANDAVTENGAPRVDLSSSVANLRAILAGAVERFPVLFVAPPPVGEPEADARLGALRLTSALVAAECGVPVLDPSGHLLHSSAWTREAEANDGAHPGAKGYADLATYVEAWSAWRTWFDG